MLEFNHMVESSLYNLDTIFHALSHPSRRAILQDLQDVKEKTISELAAPFPVSLAAISKHLQVLQKAGLIKRYKSGSFFYVSLNPEALQTADEWIQGYKIFWEAQLDSLKNFLETEEI
ncbi:MAG: metalloregulator ArsR/SmtB family transcription factor [Spirochaetota bacterium]